jgi:hypothetical protein
MTFRGQLQALLLKNLRIRSRNRRSLIVEIIYPIYFLVILIVIQKTAVPNASYPEVPLLSAALAPIGEFSAPLAPAYTCLFQRPTQGSDVPPFCTAIVAPTLSLAFLNDSATLPIVNEAIRYLNTTLGFNGSVASSITLQPVSSVLALRLAVSSNNSIGLLFNSTSSSLNYTFIPPPFSLPSTNTLVSSVFDCRPAFANFSSATGRSSAPVRGATDGALPTACAPRTYLRSFVIALQVAIDAAWLRVRGGGAPVQIDASVAQLPMGGTFRSLGSGPLSFLTMYVPLGLGFFVQFLIQFVVSEKEKKLREGAPRVKIVFYLTPPPAGMRMMGLSDMAWWLSWALTYALIELVIAIVPPPPLPLAPSPHPPRPDLTPPSPNSDHDHSHRRRKDRHLRQPPAHIPLRIYFSTRPRRAGPHRLRVFFKSQNCRRRRHPPLPRRPACLPRLHRRPHRHPPPCPSPHRPPPRLLPLPRLRRLLLRPGPGGLHRL